MTTSTLSAQVSALGYMDDSNWLAHSQKDLEDILEVADEFYSITKAAINKSKSQLLTNAVTTSQPIPIKFGSSIVDIKPELGSTRFLGVWINIFNSKLFIKRQTMDTIAKFTSILKSKPLTEKQLIYILNMVLFPLLEYRLQTTPLSFNECNRIAAPLRRIVKHNSSMTSSTPNCIVKGSVFYNLNDLWTQQMKSYSTALLYQFNTKSLYKQVSTIRLFQLQTQHSLHVSPFKEWKIAFNAKSYRNIIGATLSLLNYDNIGISFTTNHILTNKIKEGSLPLNLIFDNMN